MLYEPSRQRSRGHTIDMYTLLASTLLAALLSTVECADCPDFPKKASEATKDLKSLCSSESKTATACSLWAACARNSSLSVCQPTSVLASLCVDNAALPVCTAMASTYTSDVAAKECWKAIGVPQLPLTAYIQEDMQRLCQSQLDNLIGCEVCNNATSIKCSNPVGTLSKMCYGANMISSWSTTYCKSLDGFCQTLQPGSLPSVCGNATQAANSPLPFTSSELCIQDSTQASCQSYTYPDSSSRDDIAANCQMMADMTACTAWDLCQSKKVSGQYCQPFTILASACKEMPGMSPCNNFNALCKTGSKVEQCKQQRPIPSLPDTLATRNSILASCSDHSMPSCDTCTDGINKCTDPLSTISALCHEMPEMSVCTPFFSFCSATGGAFKYLCRASTRRYLPTMKMYFHQRVADIVLWRQWIPSNKVSYALSLIAIVFIGMVSQLLKVVRLLVEAKWAKKVQRKQRAAAAPPSKLVDVAARGSWWAVQQRPAWLSTCLAACAVDRAQMKRSAIRSVFQGIVMTLDYFNMLVAMTFNAGMFAAVVAGYSLGTLLFSHLLENHKGAVAEVEQFPLPAAPAVGADDDEDEACNCTPADLDMGCNC